MLFLACCAACVAHAQPLENAGGVLTSDLPRAVLLELPAPILQGSEVEQEHLRGHALFHRSFRGVLSSRKPILGPRFSNDGCGSCHTRSGRGAVAFGRGSIGSSLVVRTDRRLQQMLVRGLRDSRSPIQVQNHSLRRTENLSVRLRWRITAGRYRDGTPFTLRRPFALVSLPQSKRGAIARSLRATPPVVGMGLLEGVPESTLTALEDPTDRDGDGISGRAHRVRDELRGVEALGRFGFRGSHPSLLEQTAAALFHDMGIESEIFSHRHNTIEISRSTLDALVAYLRLSGVPRALRQDEALIVQGRELFTHIGCTGCHLAELATGDTAEPALLRNQTFHPFSDLLLHDMGPGLRDPVTEGAALAEEWRTTPLWGLGLREVISPMNSGFLHDGRARSLEEAILWHGGEAERSREQFVGLAHAQRVSLIEFLRTL